jgi:ppGpp synthetase/RelA/SpoT-type nucleotidyltranferase
MMENKGKIDEVVEFFESKEIDRLVKMIRLVTVRMEQELLDVGILARVSSRVKSSSSLRGKLQKWAEDPEKADRITGDPETVLARVSDLAAARVMTYTEKDRDAVAEIAQSIFRSPPGYNKLFDLEKKEDDRRIKGNPRNHYRATHMMISIHENDLNGEFSNLKFDKCELQITSLLAHVWNEIEHDTIYKTLSGDLSELERDAIDSLGHLTKTGDNIIKSLLRARQVREDQEEDTLRRENARFSHSEDLASFLEEHYGKNINGKSFDFGQGAAELLALLRAINWHHPYNVTSNFSPKFLAEARKETVKLKKFLEDNNRIKPRVVLDSSDVFVVGAIIKRKDDLWRHFSGHHKNKREVAILSAYAERVKL